MEQKKVKEILIGAAIGGALGALLASFLSKQQSDEEDFDFEDTDIEEKGHFSVIWGGASGALLGAVAALYFYPKNIEDHAVESILDKISLKTKNLVDTVNKNSQQVSGLISDRTQYWAEKAISIAEGVADDVREWSQEVIDAASRAQESCNPKCQRKLEEIKEWGQKAIEIVEHVTYETERWKDKIESVIEEEGDLFTHEEKIRNNGSLPVKEIIEWAQAGIGIWKNLKR